MRIFVEDVVTIEGVAEHALVTRSWTEEQGEDVQEVAAKHGLIPVSAMHLSPPAPACNSDHMLATALGGTSRSEITIGQGENNSRINYYIARSMLYAR
jgi:hypothetical protein